MHPRSASSSRCGSPAAGWCRAGASRARRSTSRRGPCCSASSAAGSTTSSPRPARTGARAATRSTPSRSGRAASASGAPSRSARSAPGSGAGGPGISFLAFADAAAPGVAFAQAIGRFGNWFNNELYGGPTTVPWGLQIHEWDQSRRPGRARRGGQPGGPGHLPARRSSTRRSSSSCSAPRCSSSTSGARSRPGQLLGLYVAGYPVGRIVIEKMRTDEAELVLGQRLNVWTSIVVFLLGRLDLLVHRAPGAGARRPTGGVNPSPRMWDSAGSDGKTRGAGDILPGRGQSRPRLTLPCPVPGGPTTPRTVMRRDRRPLLRPARRHRPVPPRARARRLRRGHGGDDAGHRRPRHRRPRPRRAAQPRPPRRHRRRPARR